MICGVRFNCFSKKEKKRIEKCVKRNPRAAAFWEQFNK